MGFLKDLACSQEGVNVVISHLMDKKSAAYRILGKDEQHIGDIEYDGKFIEVKFDKYAKKSNNLCFELSNGKKDTGILSTGADVVAYVVPCKAEGRYMIFYFDTKKLRDWLAQDSSKQFISIKRGGDKKKFKMALVKITDVVNLELCNTMEIVGD